VTYANSYGGSNLYQMYPATFTTVAGGENVQVIYTDDGCAMTYPSFFACSLVQTNSNGWGSIGIIYISTAFQDGFRFPSEQGRQDLIRNLISHEFGHVLGLGDFYHSPTCFGYSPDIMCGGASDPITTYDIYVVTLKWNYVHGVSPVCAYGIPNLPGGIPFEALTSTSYTVNGWRKVTSGTSTTKTPALWIHTQTGAQPTSKVLWDAFITPLSTSSLYYGSTVLPIGEFPSAPMQTFNALCYSSVAGIGSTTSVSNAYRLAVVSSSYEVYVGKETSQTVTDWSSACGVGQPLRWWIKIPEVIPSGLPQKPQNTNPTDLFYGWDFTHTSNDVTSATARFTIPTVSKPYSDATCSGYGCAVSFWVGIQDGHGNLVQGGVITHIGIMPPTDQTFYETFYQVWDTTHSHDWPTVEGYSCGGTAKPGDIIEVSIHQETDGWHVDVSDVSSTCTALHTVYPLSFDTSHVTFTAESSAAAEVPAFEPIYISGNTISNGVTYSINDLFSSSLFSHTRLGITDSAGYPYMFVYDPSTPPPGFVISNPKYPVLQSPLDGATVGAPVTFTWSSVTEATEYILAVTGGNNILRTYSVPGTKSSTQTTMSYTVSSSMLPPSALSGSYLWNVEAISPIGQIKSKPAAWSFKVSATVQSSLVSPIKTAPADGAVFYSWSIPEDFSWLPVTGANQYLFVLVDVNTGQQWQVTTTFTRANPITWPSHPLQVGHTYRWTVFAGNSLTGQWSTTATFWTFRIA
jgi:hypothetical protein